LQHLRQMDIYLTGKRYFNGFTFMGNVLGVLHVVSDLDRMVSFFTQVLEFKEVERLELEGVDFEKLYQLPKGKAKLVKLQLGDEFNYLMEFSSSKQDSFPEDSRSNDLWFQHIAIVVSDMEKAYAKLIKNGVSAISESCQTIPEWNKSAAGVKAFYFRSPEGHPLELIYFPPGKGNPNWQKKKGLFLGIDHTAIGVASTEKSLEFYQDNLGMQVVGGSLNYGDTQEKLSGVTGAKVKITTMQFPDSKSMGIEFLEYLNPLDGRKKQVGPADRLFETQTLFQVDDLEKTLMTLDPDGHRILLVIDKSLP